jgi:nucleoside-diphosphate-sugar epimerase
MQSKKILVTGGAGLLGNELIRQLLAAGENVLAIYHNTPITINHANLQQAQCDILDVVRLDELMQQATHVYHCAAIVSFSPTDKQLLTTINVEGTANVVNAALDNKIEKLIHVSSVAALGRLRQNATINETMEWTPQTSNSVYGESKYLGEMEVWRAAAEGLKIAIVNPSIILGEIDWNNSSTAIFKNVYDEFGWYTTGSTGWVDVRDVATSMILLMNSNIVNEKYIISGQNATYQTVFNHIADEFGKKRPNKKVTPLVAAIVWRLEKLKTWFSKNKPLITKETAQTALTTVHYNNQKFLADFPQFKYTPLQESISRICHYLKTNLV